MANNRLDEWNARLTDAAAVVDAIQHAKTLGLEVEFTMTFLDHHRTNQYSVADCIFHSQREWDFPIYRDL